MGSKQKGTSSKTKIQKQAPAKGTWSSSRILEAQRKKYSQSVDAESVKDKDASFGAISKP